MKMIPSDKEMFHEKILPQIRKAVVKYEQAEYSAVNLKWQVNLKFIDNFQQIE